MNRRRALALFATGTAIPGAVATTVLRLHATPRRTPFLTQAHLASIAPEPAGPPSLLFIGNSMVLRHDVPERVRIHAARAGRQVQVAMAAADGARLIETLRIAEIEPLLTRHRWSVVVFQDFTKTPLRLFDRAGSRHAIRRMAKMAEPARIVLYPPWPAMADNGVYHDAGFLTAEPDDPADFARQSLLHYTQVANQIGASVAPVPLAWLAAAETGPDIYAPDGHHASPTGADLAAKTLWSVIADELPDG